MIPISEQDIDARLLFDNPWWELGKVSDSYADMPLREYFRPFYELISNREYRRATVLLGPRRVGKTVLIHQAINRLLSDGVSGESIFFVSLETPVYSEIALASFVDRFLKRFSKDSHDELYFFFDEVQYLKNWEVHLKSLVDSWPNFRFVVSGSAAAALRLKSNESGAGRFTDFFLPPLTFHEYLHFTEKSDLVIHGRDEAGISTYDASDIDALNMEFLRYLDIGGYPEAVFNESIRSSPERFIKSDIIDKVLLRDLPQLYGIRDIQELNRLFTTLAYNTGNEVSLEELAQSSGVGKTTLRRYIEYLEAAFLIRRIDRVDRNAKRFQRASSFKVYLTNPTMRAALFGKAAEDDQSMGALAETGIYAQWFHATEFLSNIHYARWQSGEIDIVAIDNATLKPIWCVEVKWTDRPSKDRRLLRHVISFCKQHAATLQGRPTITTRSVKGRTIVDEIEIELIPTSLYAYALGANLTSPESLALSKEQQMGLFQPEAPSS